MVRNTTGGTGTKSLARKFQNKNSSSLRLAEDEFERYGVVSKHLGNSMCTITFNDGSTLLGHIRNKFSGRNKRSNLIPSLSFVLVGLRHFESPFKNCDILEVYDHLHVSLLSQISSIHINHLLSLHSNFISHSDSHHNDITFSNDFSTTPISTQPIPHDDIHTDIDTDIDFNDI